MKVRVASTSTGKMGHNYAPVPQSTYTEKFMNNMPYMLAGLLILGYLCYQFGGMYMKGPVESELDCVRSRCKIRSHSRSRSKSRSPASSRDKDIRGRRSPRCPSCGTRFQ